MYKRNRHSAELTYAHQNRAAINMTPACVSEFKAAIKHLKGADATHENKTEGRAIINHYVGRLQMLDLTLSQGDAMAVLTAAYKSI